MRHIVLCLMLGGVVAPVWADEVDIENGKNLHNTHCNACHQSMSEGDPNQLYTRENRRVTNAGQLQNQVQRCSLNLRLEWFDTEINDVSAYLNQQFYHFKP